MVTNTKYNNYRKALVEVDAALKCLKYDDYKKIPQDVFEIIENNMDKEYDYEFDEKVEYEDWNLMPEAKALLYKIFKQYLASDEQLNYLNKKERFERSKIEEQKKKIYSNNKLFKNYEIEKTLPKDNQLIEYKESIIKKFLKKIVAFFRNYN